MNDIPVVIDENGDLMRLPASAPLTIGAPKDDNHAVTLEVLQQLIEEKTNE
jgi:hypothetical protein